MSIMFYEDYQIKENGELITKQNYYPVTLSFNTSNQIKAFVSLHDFYYHYGFNTKTKCYFLSPDNKDICYINKEYKGCYSKLELLQDKTYPQQKQTSYILASSEDKNNSPIIRYNIESYNSIIDIIVNDNYETIKTLNSVNWCGTKIISEFREINETDISTLRISEDINYEIPCKYIRIYSDSCMTPLNDCTIRSNDKNIDNIGNYIYPRYNQGYWTFNYFRNILNSKGHISKSDYSGDNNSLVEGKYFVVRFVFDTDFKFETLTINYTYK